MGARAAVCVGAAAGEGEPPVFGGDLPSRLGASAAGGCGAGTQREQLLDPRGNGRLNRVPCPKFLCSDDVSVSGPRPRQRQERPSGRVGPGGKPLALVFP